MISVSPGENSDERKTGFLNIIDITERRNAMGKKVIGIIGGMGPLATADLFRKITEHTSAACDQDHPRVCIDSNTDIADRTEALIHGGKDPVPEIVNSVHRLESIGAEVLLMPCNTAHGFYDRIAAEANVPVLHMIRITRDALLEKGVRCAGLLATDGTIETGVYHDVFKDSGITLITPEKKDQKAVMDVIYQGVKKGNRDYDGTAFLKACTHLQEQGAEILILGCTELPLAFEWYRPEFPVIDPTLELALSAIRFAGCTVK